VCGKMERAYEYKSHVSADSEQIIINLQAVVPNVRSSRVPSYLVD
jgi:hypothetical protein